jgi:hypothetical protein
MMSKGEDLDQAQWKITLNIWLSGMAACSLTRFTGARDWE